MNAWDKTTDPWQPTEEPWVQPATGWRLLAAWIGFSVVAAALLAGVVWLVIKVAAVIL